MYTHKFMTMSGADGHVRVYYVDTNILAWVWWGVVVRTHKKTRKNKTNMGV